MAHSACAPYILEMDVAALWDQLAAGIAGIPQSGLLIAAVISVLFGIVGGFLASKGSGLGRAMRRASTLGLLAVFCLVVLQLGRFDPRFNVAVPELGLPEQTVSGGETRLPLAADGHYWLQATVNGQPAEFLVDTGATLTAISEDTARKVGAEPRPGGIPVQLRTANGAVTAQLTSLDSLRFGNIEANGLDAVIAPNIGKVNVVGMNFLSRLASWRVEGQTMILVPAPDQFAEPIEEGAAGPDATPDTAPRPSIDGW